MAGKHNFEGEALIQLFVLSTIKRKSTYWTQLKLFNRIKLSAVTLKIILSVFTTFNGKACNYSR